MWGEFLWAEKVWAASEEAATGSLNQTLAALSLASSGTLASGTTGTLNQTLGVLSLSSSGVLSTGLVGSLDATLGSLQLNSAGILVPGASGALTTTLGPLLLTSTGTLAAGATGSLTSTLAALTLSSSGAILTPITGTLVRTLGPLVLNSTGGAIVAEFLSVDAKTLFVFWNDTEVISLARCGVTAFNAPLKPIVRGDTRKVERTFTNAPTGITLDQAWLTVKSSPSLADPGLFQVAITTSPASTGQITDSSTSDGQVSMYFIISGTDSAAAIGGAQYFYDIQVRSAGDGAITTLAMGTVTFFDGITLAS